MAGLIAARDRLNAADAKLGDGDTGTMLARSARAVLHDLPPDAAADPATLLRTAAEAVARETGSSLGTLLALGLRRCAKELGSGDPVRMSDVSAALAAAASQMRIAGGAQPGDKTVVDFLDAMAQQTAQVVVAADILAAGELCLDTFRPKPCRIGRARLYPETSCGADDPGMLAGIIALQAMCEDPGQG